MKTKEIQGKLWSIAPQLWSNHFEPYFTPLYNETLKQIKVHDTSILDAGCGSGLFTKMATDSGARVIGVDAAGGLLQIARMRNPSIVFMEEDLEELPFATNSFDIAVAYNSLQYAGSFNNALNELKRVVEPGGKLIIGIWDKPENSEATNILKAIGSILPPPPPGTPGPFALSEDGKMESVIKENGLRLISKTIVSCPFLYSSLENAVNSFMGTGPAAAALKVTDEQQLRRHIAKALEPYHLTDSLYHLQNSFLLFIIEK